MLTMTTLSVLLVQFSVSSLILGEQVLSNDQAIAPAAVAATPISDHTVSNSIPATRDNKVVSASEKTVLEPRINNFVRDILDRLHALDNDIGKLLVNSTSMYAPNDENIMQFHKNSKGGEKFTEILHDLDALQDEIGALLNNATRTRQYNMLVRLRPLNNIVYRIRHNLHLMRNSLAAVNTVAQIEKIGNSVLDSTLRVFLQPDAGDEIGDSGNYDINLDNMNNIAATSTAQSQTPTTAFALVSTMSSSTTESSSTTTKSKSSR